MSIETIIYKTHPRSRRLTMRITSESKIIVTVPRFVSKKAVAQFIEQHEEWIQNQLEKIKNTTPAPRRTAEEIRRAKINARQLVLKKLLHFNQHYHFYYASVSIRSQHTRWGSCSRRKHLSFNYKLIFLPEELQDYIVVHELCHLQQMNHSKQFWTLVAQTIPHHQKLRKHLQTFHL